MKKDLRIAVVGATGAVGRELLTTLNERAFPVGELVPIASARSEGKAISYNRKGFLCQSLSPQVFENVDIAFFDVPDAVSKQWVPKAAECGAWVIDNSATFRFDSNALLSVPEVNGAMLEARIEKRQKLSPSERVIANPNCSTAQMVVALKPLEEQFGIERVVVSTYQSTSGAGYSAKQELIEQTREVLGGAEVAFEPKAFPHQIAFNCIPQVGSFDAEGHTSEEKKMIEESRKILSRPDLRITATCVRVPTLACHGESLNVELRKDFTLDAIKDCLGSFKGIEVIDEPEKSRYPLCDSQVDTGIVPGRGKNLVYVGRIRRDASVDHGLNLWVVSDNLRKGAAFNAVQIAEKLLEGGAFS